jgi:hypothetical protein
MAKLTISMAIFNSFLYVYQIVDGYTTVLVTVSHLIAEESGLEHGPCGRGRAAKVADFHGEPAKVRGFLGAFFAPRKGMSGNMFDVKSIEIFISFPFLDAHQYSLGVLSKPPSTPPSCPL